MEICFTTHPKTLSFSSSVSGFFTQDHECSVSQCRECRKIFITKGKMADPVRKVHGGEFACEQCEKI